MAMIIKLKALIQKKQGARYFVYYLIAAVLILIFVFSPKAGIYDWDKELFYVQTARESIREYGSLPYVLWNREPFTFYPVVGQTALFISYPETFLFSPLMPLALWLNPMAFLKAVTLIHFAIGCLGVWMLGRLFKWHASQVRLFSAMFLLSPIILQHVAIGYLPWVTLYYFPWLLVFMWHEKRSARILGTGAVLAACLLNGGAHTVFWFGLFMGISYAWSVVQDRRRWLLAADVLAAAAVCTLLASARMVSSMLAFGNFSQDFFAGYSPRAFLRTALIPPMFFIENMDHVEGLIEDYFDGVPYWDGGIYWGAVLPMVMLVLFTLAGRRNRNDKAKRLPIFLASATFLVLSMGSVYEMLAGVAVHLTGIGGLAGIEKYPFRFAIMAYYGFSVFISDHYPALISELQHWGDRFLMAARTFIKWIENRMKNHQKAIIIVLKVMMLLLALLLLFDVILKPAILPFLHGIIQEAYEGNGPEVLARMMVHKGTLPLAAYLEKGDALLDLVLQWLLTGFIVIVVALAVLAFPRQLLAGLSRITGWLISRRSAVIELVVALPLLFASVMWLRVAVSTPIESFATRSTVPIQVISIIPADARLEVLNQSMANLELVCQSPSGDRCQVVVDIPATDLAWLQISNGVHAGDDNGSLELVMPAGERVLLQVDRRGFDLAVWVMLGSWIAAAAGLVYWMLRRRATVRKT